MPAKIAPELKGFSHFDTEILLADPSAKVTLNQMLVFEQASLVENVITGKAQYTIRYSTSTLDFVEGILSAAKADGTPRVRFRQGYGEPQNIDWKPWITGLLIKHDSMPVNIGESAGHVVDMLIADDIFTAGRSNKTIARTGTISSIVSQIASENKLSAVIEDTQGEFAYVQSYLDDVRFIKRLQARATSKNGRGNYLFYVRDGVLHFHSPEYQSNYLELRYYESPQMSMGQADTGQMLFDDGISGTRLIAYDPYTGDSKEFASDPQKALRLAKGIYRLDKVTSGQLNIPYHVCANGPEDAIALGQNIYERSRMGSQHINMALQKIIDIRAGDFLNVTIAPSPQRTSAWGGVWFVEATTYLIKGGSVSSNIALSRGEVTPNRSSTVAQVPNLQLTPEQEAPGHDLSLREIQSSNQTAIPENATSNSGHATVLDATTLPV